MHLLTRLDDSYESLRTNILNRLEKEQLIVEKVYSIMLSHENKLEMSKEKFSMKSCMIYLLILLTKDIILIKMAIEIEGH